MKLSDRKPLFAFATISFISLCLSSCVSTTQPGKTDNSSESNKTKIEKKRSAALIEIDRIAKVEKAHRQATELHRDIHSQTIQQVSRFGR